MRRADAAESGSQKRNNLSALRIARSMDPRVGHGQTREVSHWKIGRG
jgi:hypothetical protein